MSQTWPILTVLCVLAVQLCRASDDKSCSILSSAGEVVRTGSSFRVYCTFKDNCEGCMYSDHPPKKQNPEIFNSTTIYLNVVNITEKRTFSCNCPCGSALGLCGTDIFAGDPPDRPTNISCIYKVLNNESGIVNCTWEPGRHTYLKNTLNLWVTTVPTNHTAGPVTYSEANKETDSSSARFTISNSTQRISVRIHVKNDLGSAESITVNYTLSDIAMPSTPELVQPECSSRECSIRLRQPVRTQHLQIQYCVDQRPWILYPDSTSTEVRVISSLEPYRSYHFRARSKFSTGWWSEWSKNVSSWTQEEAPAEEPDVWHAEPVSDFTSLRVYWKEASVSITRGKITHYRVEVSSQTSGLLFSRNISAGTMNYTVRFCVDCEVTLWAYNSKGPSPPARITPYHIKAKPLKVGRQIVNNHSVAISWRKPETAPERATYVVEWYPEGHNLEKLRWVRLNSDETQTLMTGLKPFHCYEGAVYVVYNQAPVSKSKFTGIFTLETAPTAAPLFEATTEGNTAKVTWVEIPVHQRRGCITNYTIYLENGSIARRAYSVPASVGMHTIKDLPPSFFMWMTASTAQGEGPAGDKIKLDIERDGQLLILLLSAVVTLFAMFLLCLCQRSAVKQRVWLLFQCLMLSDVPDPANSKWAKECTQEKGKIKLQLSNSTMTEEEEEEPVLVDIEELPAPSSDARTPTDISSGLPRQSGLNQPTTVLYPLTAYLKSFSHDSDSSEHTQTSLETNTTVDYISSHGLGTMGEEDLEEEEEEEEEFVDMLGFFPSHGIVIDQLQFGGKLTLDAVKIGGGDFFQNNNF